jgi:hypothetical protein
MKPKYTHCTVTIDMPEGHRAWPAGEHDYTVWFDYSPGRPGKMYLRNGDPGYPDEPPELEITEIERDNWGEPISDDDGQCILSDEQYASVEQQVIDWINEQEESACAAEYEYWSQRAKEQTE